MIDDMGIFRTTVGVGSLSDPQRRVDVEHMMVDTGSEYTWIAEEHLAQLGVAPVRIDRFETADGRKMKIPKNTVLRRGVKAQHLAYLGDADVGAGSNVGAGVITCNYDGEKKHPTKIGQKAFIGSDVQLVAPVSVGDGAYVGAGTTVTEDVPPGALALSRTPQVNKEGWVARRKAKNPKSE